MRRQALIAALILLAAPLHPARADSAQGDPCSAANQVYTDAESAAYPGPNTFVCNGSTLQNLTTVLANPTRFGIGTASPAAPLHVNGEALIGMQALACGGTTAGAIRYNSSNQKFELCNGTSWASPPATMTPAGSNTQIQLNDHGVLYASSGLTFNSSTGVLTNANRIIIGGSGKDTSSVFVSGGNGTSTGSSNIAIGPFALYSATTASSNTAVGISALFSETTGTYNTAVGISALGSAAADTYNTAVGAFALSGVTTASNNTAVGVSALSSATAGNNTAVGYQALSNAPAGNNTAVGYQALLSATASNNTAVGYQALTANTTGTPNTALGYQAGMALTTGTNNVAIGDNTLTKITTTGNGNGSTAVGSAALKVATKGPNTAVGYQALTANTTGTLNAAFGYQAGMKLTTGKNNVLIGGSAGAALTVTGNGDGSTAVGSGALQAITNGPNTALGNAVGSATLTTGSNDILIGTGSAVDTPLSSTSNFLNIGNTIFATGTMTGTVASPAGKVGIGTASPTATLDVNGDIRLSDGTQNCSHLTDTGAIRYNSLTFKLQSCKNGSGWTDVGSGGNPGSGTIGATSGVLVELTAGSAAAPSLTFYADTTTGIYQPSASTMAITTGGTEHVAVDASGNENLLTAQAAFEIGGNNAISEPLDSTAGGSIAIGTSALATQTAAGSAAYENTAIGYQAMGGGTLTTAALDNTAVGYQALKANTSGTQNTAVGYEAGTAITSGTPNTVVGYQAGLALTTGTNNVLIGDNAGAALTTTPNCNASTAVGSSALAAATGGPNTAVGYQAGLKITSGSGNVVLGYNALKAVTTSGGNTAIGAVALGVSTAADNTAVGNNALKANTSGTPNTAVGYQAGLALTTGTNNVLIGDSAGAALTVTGNGNGSTGVGSSALLIATAGPNTAIGDAVGSTTLTTGSNNILIGTSNAVTTPLSSTSNFLNIGNTIFATGAMTGTVASPAGKVGIGTTTPAAPLHVNGEAIVSMQALACSSTTAGAIRYNSSSTIMQYCNGSAWIPFDPCTVVQPYDWGGAAGGAFPGGSAWGDGTYIYTGGAPPSSSDLEAWTFTNSTHLWTNKAYTNTPANGFYNIWGDGTYLYLSEGISGIQAYSFNGTTFTLKGTYNTTMSSNWVWGTGGTIYVADGTHGLKAFTFNGTTFTLKATAAPASINAQNVWGDGTYLYVIDAGNDVVDAYTFSGSAFTLKGTLASPGWGSWSYVSGDGTYVYVTGKNGYNMITAYTFNGTSFSQQGSSRNFIGDPGGDMWIYNGDIYVATTGIEVYSFGGSSFTYKGFIPSYASPTGNIWADSSNIYWSDGFGIDFYASSLCH